MWLASLPLAFTIVASQYTRPEHFAASMREKAIQNTDENELIAQSPDM